jgi:hydrocephalus-inducing protein
MFTQRSHTFKIKNVSLINMNYRCKIVSAESGIPDTGYYQMYPKMGVIAPSCDE